MSGGAGFLPSTVVQENPPNLCVRLNDFDGDSGCLKSKCAPGKLKAPESWMFGSNDFPFQLDDF